MAYGRIRQLRTVQSRCWNRNQGRNIGELVGNALKNKELLDEVKENFEYAVKSWDDHRKERAKDFRYAAGDPWDAAERKQREDNYRPCVSSDELNQYIG